MPASMCHYDQHFYAFSQVFTIARQDVYLLKHLPKPGEISVVCLLVEQAYAGIFVCLFLDLQTLHSQLVWYSRGMQALSLYPAMGSHYVSCLPGGLLGQVLGAQAT